jgi:hypothetical protein
MQASPSWGEYFGVMSQSVATATAATEVEVTVVTHQQRFERLKLDTTDWSSLEQPVLYIPLHRHLHKGMNKISLCATSVSQAPVLMFACASDGNEVPSFCALHSTITELKGQGRARAQIAK